VTATALRRFAGLALAAAAALAACGGDQPRELSGFRRDPPPAVGTLALPDTANGDAEFPLRAAPGDVLVVYFGYTNCPDFCPTTLSDLKLALRRMDPADAERVEVAMVTIDPARDLPILADYITSFFDDGHALGTDDDALLRRVAAPFGVAYEVDTAEDGTVEVGHTTFLYAVDDAGELVLTWQFGVPIDDLADDLTALLREEAA
jgi:protein SCO1/2